MVDAGDNVREITYQKMSIWYGTPIIGRQGCSGESEYSSVFVSICRMPIIIRAQTSAPFDTVFM